MPLRLPSSLRAYRPIIAEKSDFFLFEPLLQNALTRDLAAQDHQHQHDAHRQVQVLRIHIEAQRQAVAQDADDQGGEHGAQYGTLAAGTERAAEHDGGDDRHRIARAKVILGRVDVGGQQRAGQRRAHGAEHVGTHDRRAGIDAGIFRCLLIDADEIELLAVLGLVQNPDAQHNQQKVDHNLRRNSKDIALAQKTEADKFARFVLAGETADALIIFEYAFKLGMQIAIETIK